MTMENKTLTLLMVKWLNYAYCLPEEPQKYGIQRILQCIEDIIDIANIREKEKKGLRELIQKSEDDLFNLNTKEFQMRINKIIEQIV